MSCSPEAFPVDCEVKRPVEMDLGPPTVSWGGSGREDAHSPWLSLFILSGDDQCTRWEPVHTLSTPFSRRAARRLPDHKHPRVFVTRKTLGRCAGRAGRAKGYDSSTMIN